MKPFKELSQKKYGPPAEKQANHILKSETKNKEPVFNLANQKKKVNPPFVTTAINEDEPYQSPQHPYIRNKKMTSGEFRMKLNLEAYCGPKDCCCIERRKLWEDIGICHVSGKKYLKKWKEQGDIIWRRTGKYNVFLLLYLNKTPINRKAEFNACPTWFLLKRANQRIDTK